MPLNGKTWPAAGTQILTHASKVLAPAAFSRSEQHLLKVSFLSRVQIIFSCESLAPHFEVSLLGQSYRREKHPFAVLSAPPHWSSRE